MCHLLALQTSAPRHGGHPQTPPESESQTQCLCQWRFFPRTHCALAQRSASKQHITLCMSNKFFVIVRVS